jgi:hypothetical protein
MMDGVSDEGPAAIITNSKPRATLGLRSLGHDVARHVANFVVGQRTQV